MSEKLEPAPIDRRAMIKTLGVGAAAAAISTSSASGTTRHLDFDRPEDKLEAFLKTRGDLSGEQASFWFTGDVQSFVPGEKSRKLFRFEGLGVSRLRRQDDGWQLLHREFGVYRDPRSDAILESWNNPFLGREVEVIPVANDPVNAELTPAASRFLRHYEHSGDITFMMDFYLRYPSALPRAEYPLYSQSDMYQASELFKFNCRRAEIDDPSVTSAGCVLGWTRIGPWMPWMEMGNRPGNVVYHCWGKKLLGGVGELPGDFREYVTAKARKFLEAPTTYVKPNETSWTYFKKIIDARRNAAGGDSH